MPYKYSNKNRHEISIPLEYSVSEMNNTDRILIELIVILLLFVLGILMHVNKCNSNK